MKRYVREDGLAGPVIEREWAGASNALPPTELRFLTWNLRYDSKTDRIPVNGTIGSLPTTIPADGDVPYYSGFTEAPWSTRRINIAREVAFSKPDIIGVQEALRRQVQDLTTLFGPAFNRIGVGRDDGVDRGEFEAIYYRTSAVTLMDWDTFWLSATPFAPSKFPGAGSTRSATRARFRSTITGTVFTVLCTHWDEQSDAQRQLAASLILWRGAHEAAVTNGGPVFVLGDFNSPSDGADSTGYEIMTGAREPVEISSKFVETYGSGGGGFVFADVAVATAPVARSGHHATFTGFRRHAEMELKRIDFVMAGKGQRWRSVHYRVGESFWDDESLASDHRPVWVDVVLG